MNYLNSIILFLLVLISMLNAEKVRYDNYQVFRVTSRANNKNSINSLKKFEENFKDFSIWSKSDKSIDVMVPPQFLSNFITVLNSLTELDGKVIISNVQDLIDNERSDIKSTDFDWNDYHTFDEINNWLYSLAELYPDTVKVIFAGSTYENRNITGVHVSFSPDNENNAIFIEGNIHAREWISSAVVTFILNEILNSTDSDVRAVVESYDWYIFPVANPDGFEYTHITDRLWRKTRTPYGDCYGADPNRNWDYHFNDGGTSDRPCDETYRGPYAFSENCTQSISNYISTISDKLKGYIAFHSYSQLILIPYGYSSDHLDNYDDLYNVGLKAAESLSQRYGTDYTVGNIVDILYVASGGSMDWVKGKFHTPITYTYELRDKGLYGFILPADQIIPSGEETFDSLLTMLKEFPQ